MMVVKIKVAAIQMDPKLLDVEYNTEHSLELIDQAISEGAKVIVLPELANTGYAFESTEEALKVAEIAPGGPTVSAWEEKAMENKIYIVGGFAEKSGFRVYNSSVLVGPHGYIGTYRKLHLFDKEKEIFAPGNLDLWVYHGTDGINIGMMICFDWVFPEVARVLALKGADIITHPANLVLPYAQRAMPIRAIENRVFTVTANRVGFERGIAFTGQSLIINPLGKVLKKANKDKEAILVEEIDLSLAKDKNMTERNNLFEDRRPKYYRKLVEE